MPEARVSIIDRNNQSRWQGATDRDGVALAPGPTLRDPSRYYAMAFIVTAEKDGDLGYVSSNWNGPGPWSWNINYQLRDSRPLLRGLYATAGLMWAIFTICLRGWRTNGLLAAQVVGALSLLIYAPLYALVFGFARMAAIGLAENLIQIVIQGVFAGLLPLYLFARAVTSLGAARASLFTALVPGMTILIGFLALGDVPTIPQLLGLAIVGVGFWLALRP